MFCHARPLLTTLVLALAVGLTACADSSQLMAPDLQSPGEPALASSANAAMVESGTITIPFPPPGSGLEFVPIPAPCLGLREPLQGSGMWTIRYHQVITPQGRLHVTEHIDYSDVVIRLGELTWVAGPGAQEMIVSNVPLTADDLGDAAYNITHQINARFLSQDGLPDLRVSHSYHFVIGPDLEARRDEFIPFGATCIGAGE